MACLSSNGIFLHLVKLYKAVEEGELGSYCIVWEVMLEILLDLHKNSGRQIWLCLLMWY